MEMPRDMSMKPCKPVVPIEPGHVDEDALSGCVTKILARLASARRPVLMVGVEVRRFGKEEALATLAGQLDIPVVTSFMGCGLLVESATPPLAPYMGMTDSTEITELVENADTLFLLAVVLSDTNFGVSQRQIDLRHTIQANDGQVTLGFTRSQIFRLRRSLRHCLNAPFHGRTLQTSEPQLPKVSPWPSGLVADDRAIAPDDIARAINDPMARHGRVPLAVDVGDCLFTSMDIDHTHRVTPGCCATMGFGVPAGLGLQSTSGRRALILVGDGAFQMTGWELGNGSGYGWDQIVVVFNNAAWGMLQSFQPGSAFNRPGE